MHDEKVSPIFVNQFSRFWSVPCGEEKRDEDKAESIPKADVKVT